MFRSILATVFLVLSIPCMAAPTAVSTETYANVNWSVSGASGGGYLTGCNSLSTSITGTLSATGVFSIYGGFFCPASNTNYGVVGSGFLTTLGTIMVRLMIGFSLWNCTLNSTTLSGSCNLVGLGSGVDQGTALLTAR